MTEQTPELTCGLINFFGTEHAAHEWIGHHPEVSGVLLNQAEALVCGIAEFGTLMRPGRDSTAR
ncbi:organomercurial lyase [Phytoactinopolyspora endophytica]|uniref:organomercurial lyase n=1 Tax=Phytoactinopolyspora endophytica TaxID=1642495 RepID=UPI00101D1F1D|nr:organomercurial lyase [Phytoactinopolyspora endophytica]